MKKELKPAIQAGFALGILWGLCLFLATLSHIVFGYPGQAFLYFFKDIYLGYSVSLVGAFIGLVWAFIDAFIVGYLFIMIYKWVGKKLD